MQNPIIKAILLIVALIAVVMPLKAANSCLLFSNNTQSVSLNSSHTFGKTFTQEMWVYPQDASVAYRCLLGDITSDPTQRPPSIYQFGLKVHGGFGDGSIWHNFTTANDVLTKDSWNHLAVTFNGTDYTLYVNGLSVYTTAAFAGKEPFSTAKLTGFGHGNEVNCKIEELRIWSTARTQAEVQDNQYKELLGTESGLEGYYQMNEGSGTVVNDKTVNANHGTLVGMSNSNWVASDIPVTFTEITAGLPGVAFSSVAWGDYDNDGDLDILLMGVDGSDNFISKIYRNDPSTGSERTFTDIAADLTCVAASSVAWGDYDNDGDLDILLTGESERAPKSNPISRIYRNDNGTFTDIQAGLIGVISGSVAWGDYDNDGDLDILLTGKTGSEYISKVYRNNNGSFTEITADLTGVYASSVAWGDYDNDGDLDILLTGESEIPPNSNTISKIYRNNGKGSFTEIQAGLIEVGTSSVAWGDYDNDGDLDILLTGDIGYKNFFSKIYRNNGDGSFSDIAADLPGVGSSSVAWGDHDNDGDLDILLTGRTKQAYISRIYRNNGNGSFTDITAGLPGVSYSSVAWGDYDNDGELDILLTGAYSSVHNSKIYRNNSLTANTAPTAPANLFAQATESGINFSWNKATDSQTPQNALSYNIAIGSAANPNSVKPAHANLSSGYRKVVAMGNTNQKNSHTLKIATYPQVKYSWSVQAIDNAFAGSPFATSQAFGRDLVLKCDSVIKKTDSLFWEAAAISKINKYQIQVATTAAFDNILIDSLLINRFDSTAFVGKSIQYLNIDNRLTSGKTYYYRVKPEYNSSIYETAFSQIPAKFKYSVLSGIGDENLPIETKLYANYPNPFNPITKINYDLRAADKVKLAIYNAKGEMVKTLVNGIQNAGRYSVNFDGTSLNSGIYFYKLEADNKIVVKRMVMIK